MQHFHSENAKNNQLSVSPAGFGGKRVCHGWFHFACPCAKTQWRHACPV